MLELATVDQSEPVVGRGEGSAAAPNLDVATKKPRVARFLNDAGQRTYGLGGHDPLVALGLGDVHGAMNRVAGHGVDASSRTCGTTAAPWHRVRALIAEHAGHAQVHIVNPFTPSTPSLPCYCSKTHRGG
jgi:hypothetical protein